MFRNYVFLKVLICSFIFYRIDTLLYLLCYPQVPLVRTKVRSVSVCLHIGFFEYEYVLSVQVIYLTLFDFHLRL